MFFVYPTSRDEKSVHLVLALETRDLDSSYNQRKFVYEFTTNNNFFFYKQKLLLYCYIDPMLCFPFASKDFVCPLLRWITLDLELQRIKKNIKDFSKHIVSDGQMELCPKYKCIFIWCSYHFNTPFCVMLQYPQSRTEILCQKEKQYSVKLHDFFHILCRMDTFFKRLIIYESGITINVSNA